ncbi:MAG TPA: MATE family efflux transporter [Alphaproteobacteria bacterium]|nr:MATE family efflux transporter [Alphaproteobacteria bacterium]
MSHSSSKRDLTEGSVRRHLIRLTIPMIWGILAIISFQLVDAYYISLLGTDHLAAISYTFPITYGIFSLFIGMGVATSSVISRLIGAKEFETIKRVTSHAIVLVLGISVVAAIIGIPFLNPLFGAMGADEKELEMIRSFMFPYFLGTFFVSMPVVGNAALRASGDAVVPAIIMTVAAVANMIVDPILIFGLFGFPRLELFGAAISTVIANFCAMLAGFYVMYRRELFDFEHLRNWHKFGDSCKRLLIIGLPVGITSMLPSFVNSTITGLLSKTGPAAVAAFGAATRIEALTLVVMMALSIGMAPLVGQNWGAKNVDRVKTAVREALIFSVLWSVVMAALLVGFSSQIADLFSTESVLHHYLVLFLMIVPLSYPLGNLTHSWGSAFNAMGKPQISSGLLFLKLIVIMIPATMVGYDLAGAMGVFIAIVAVNVITGVGFHFWAWRRIGHHASKLA